MAVSENYDKKKKLIIEFLLTYFPSLNLVHTQQIIESLLYVIKERNYSYGTTISYEGQYSDKFYILYDGECSISKNVIVDESANAKGEIQGIK